LIISKQQPSSKFNWLLHNSDEMFMITFIKFHICMKTDMLQ